MRTVTVADQNDVMDYTPFEGMRLTGWPVHVLSRGETIVADGTLQAQRGRGRFVARAPYRVPPNAPVVPGVDPAHNFGARILP